MCDEYYFDSYLLVLKLMNYSYSYLYRGWLPESIHFQIFRANKYLLNSNYTEHLTLKFGVVWQSLERLEEAGIGLNRQE